MKKRCFYLVLLALSAFFAFLVACGDGEPTKLEEWAVIQDSLQSIVDDYIPGCAANPNKVGCPKIEKPSSSSQPPVIEPSSSSENNVHPGVSSSSPGPGPGTSSAVVGVSSSAVAPGSSAVAPSSSATQQQQSSSSRPPSSSAAAPASSSATQQQQSSSSRPPSSSAAAPASSSATAPLPGGCAYQPSWCDGMAKNQITTPASLTFEQNSSATKYCYFLTEITDNRQGSPINGTETACGATDWGQKPCSEVLTKVDGGYYVYTKDYGFKVTGTNSSQSLSADCK